MGKDRKQQAEYDYLHGNKPVEYNIFQRLRWKWARHNWDIGEYRQKRVEQKEKDFDKINKDELD